MGSIDQLINSIISISDDTTLDNGSISIMLYMSLQGILNALIVYPIGEEQAHIDTISTIEQSIIGLGLDIEISRFPSDTCNMRDDMLRIAGSNMFTWIKWEGKTTFSMPCP